MRISTDISRFELLPILDHADELCKEFDPTSRCKDFLEDKLNSTNTTPFTLINDNEEILGLGIVEILDINYGNLILHTINEEDEAYFAHFIQQSGIIKNNILELIQFRSTFNYRDEFIRMGYREKERVRMIHKNIKSYKSIKPEENVTYTPITVDNCDICGDISYHSHKHRINIECYDAYASIEQRTKFCLDLRSEKHGKSIDPACLILNYNHKPVGVIDITHVRNFDVNMGWIMDISLLPNFQGIGLGRHLMEYALGQLNLAGYEQAGLGVTMSNKNAHRLYQSLGFEEYEYFIEIIAR